MSYKGTPLSSQIIWLEQRVEQLESGPGGIMEMKQTIADKESRIEQLEAALRFYACDCKPECKCGLEYYSGVTYCGHTARKALKEKEPLQWTENYGQGSEPWLKDEK